MRLKFSYVIINNCCCDPQSDPTCLMWSCLMVFLYNCLKWKWKSYVMSEMIAVPKDLSEKIEGRLSLVDLKDLARKLLPANSVLRILILSESDKLLGKEGIAKLEIFLKLLYQELEHKWFLSGFHCLIIVIHWNNWFHLCVILLRTSTSTASKNRISRFHAWIVSDSRHNEKYDLLEILKIFIHTICWKTLD